MAEKRQSQNTIKAVERATTIIDHLHENDSLTLTDLSDQLEMPTSTVHIYLQTLEQEGFIVRENNGYRLSLKFLKYGGYLRQDIDVFNPARFVLRELAIQTGERAGLGVEERNKRVQLYMIDGSQTVSDNIPVGETTEMHWTGLGKCLLAFLSQEKQEEIIKESSLKKATPKTITDEGVLKNELKSIRQKGYAIEDEERRQGIRCVAVPILTPDEKILGAIGLTGPAGRFDEDTIGKYINLLQEKSNIIKLKIVY